MKIQSVNNNSNSMNFGANIKFANPKYAETIYSTRTKKLLNQVKKISPDTNITIRYIKANSPEDSFLEAKNESTGVKIREHIAKIDYQKNSNDLSTCIGTSDSFLRLLETILNPHYLIHDDFWYGEKHFEPSFNVNRSKNFVA
jgi:hypothetical protein